MQVACFWDTFYNHSAATPLQQSTYLRSCNHRLQILRCKYNWMNQVYWDKCHFYHKVHESIHCYLFNKNLKWNEKQNDNKLISEIESFLSFLLSLKGYLIKEIETKKTFLAKCKKLSFYLSITCKYCKNDCPSLEESENLLLYGAELSDIYTRVIETRVEVWEKREIPFISQISHMKRGGRFTCADKTITGKSQTTVAQEWSVCIVTNSISIARIISHTFVFIWSKIYFFVKRKWGKKNFWL